jgi:hypothetical protein
LPLEGTISTGPRVGPKSLGRPGGEERSGGWLVVVLVVGGFWWLGVMGYGNGHEAAAPRGSEAARQQAFGAIAQRACMTGLEVRWRCGLRGCAAR